MPFLVAGCIDAPNALGSNIVLTDDNQNVLVRYEYDVFGAIRAETGTSDNTRKFTGKEFDADSNLYYYAARYYDPYIGRFTQRDPIGDGVNWYVYTRNNPLKFVDPTGTRIIILGPPDSQGKSSVEVNIGAEGTVARDSLSKEGQLFLDGIEGRENGVSLADTNIFGDTIKELINSDTAIFLTFDSSLDKKIRGDTDFVNLTSDDQIMIRINAEYAAGENGDFFGLRIALVHELTHAEQLIENPDALKKGDYYSVYNLEYEAYDRGELTPIL